MLTNYDINKKQIYSVTTDNGRNLIKAIELLSQQEVEIESEGEDVDDDGDQNQNEDFVENIISSIRFENVISIKCAAHTLQLSVKDFLRDCMTDINRARNTVKVLRAPSFR